MKHRLKRRYGRALSRKALMERFEVNRIRINSQGYDRNGRYYGSGAPLFRVYDNQDGLTHETRAQSAPEAREKAIAYWMKHESYSGEYGRKAWSPFGETVKEEFYPSRRY
jgi:hypothetical protein